VLAGAEHDGELSGFVCYGPTPASDATYDLYWIAVRRDLQGHGVGRALLAYVEDAVRRDGGRLLVIETSGGEHYGATRAFYERVGYHEVARVRDFYDVGEDRLVLVRRLRAATG
jgi:ribosomal protein S18 acetylase RimI-like enzyme